MGCSTSKPDDEAAFQLCKDRKRFIKQALEQRGRFASGHIAYIQSLKRVSAALRDYIEGDEPREFLLDSFITPPFTPVKKASPGLISISPKSFSPAPNIQSKPRPCVKICYLRSGGKPAVSVEERPESPETGRVEAYSPMHHYGMDGLFGMQSSPMNSSSFFSYSPNNRPNIPPPSPQNSQWDFFWNPFSSLDYYGYPTRNSLDQRTMDEEVRGLRQSGLEIELEAQIPSHSSVSIEVSQSQTARQVKTNSQERAVELREAKEETPGFTVYMNRRPTSMAEIIKELDTQFTIVCNAANEVSTLLEASREQYSSSSNELSAMKMLNPVALFCSASSRFLMNSSCTKDEGYESSSDVSEDPCMFSGSHQSTLDRLYAWEKKLYEEVKSGEKVRIAYEKKLMQLRNQDVKGDDHSAVEKTRVAIRDMQTRMKVSIHTVEAISKRIETMRDEELQPQLSELVQGLARMWKVMAKCHRSQKRSLDEAKLLLAGTPSKLEAKRQSSISAADPNRLARSAANLEKDLRNWRALFQSWITSQRSYVQPITGWLLCCMRAGPDTSNFPLSGSSGALPIYGICIQWSRFLDAILTMSSLTEFAFASAEGYAELVNQWDRDKAKPGAAAIL
ncbi:hypothetical protein ACFXTI_012974 [Malus domestica]